MHGLTSLPIGNLHGIEEAGHLLVQGTRPVQGKHLLIPGQFLCPEVALP